MSSRSINNSLLLLQGAFISVRTPQAHSQFTAIFRASAVSYCSREQRRRAKVVRVSSLQRNDHKRCNEQGRRTGVSFLMSRMLCRIATWRGPSQLLACTLTASSAVYCAHFISYLHGCRSTQPACSVSHFPAASDLGLCHDDVFPRQVCVPRLHSSVPEAACCCVRVCCTCLCCQTPSSCEERVSRCCEVQGSIVYAQPC